MEAPTGRPRVLVANRGEIVQRVSRCVANSLQQGFIRLTSCLKALAAVKSPCQASTCVFRPYFI